MTQYIDKAALVAEIERLSAYLDSIHEQRIIEKILSIINTLELKEVDLEKEIQDYIYTLPYSKTGIPNGWKHSWERKDVEKIAKHFFELGIKMKGEQL